MSSGSNTRTDPMGKLIQIGRKCAVLGVEAENPMGGPWHILQPGTFAVPLLDDGNKTIGRSLCRRQVVTNGYAADWVPAGDSLCPACRERI